MSENYDPQFASIARGLRSSSSQTDVSRQGIMLVAGYNFGTGSSREQAATALKNAGIPLVIGGSFGDIYKRNSINNGLILVECPAFVAELTERFAKDGVRGQGARDGKLTVVPEGWSVIVDVAKSTISVTSPNEEDRVHSCATVGASVQEIWVHGGLEGFIKASAQIS